MIQANELRIGNLIFDDDGALCKIIGFQPYGHSVRCDESEGCDILIDIYAADGKIRKGFSVESTLVNPIPLTPELLEKCGFVNGGYHDGGDSSWGRPDFPFKLTNNDGAPGFSVYYYDDNDCVYPADVDYLHQLQNLYFCLNGEELPVKL